MPGQRGRALRSPGPKNGKDTTPSSTAFGSPLCEPLLWGAAPFTWSLQHRIQWRPCPMCELCAPFGGLRFIATPKPKAQARTQCDKHNLATAPELQQETMAPVDPATGNSNCTCVAGVVVLRLVSTLAPPPPLTPRRSFSGGRHPTHCGLFLVLVEWETGPFRMNGSAQDGVTCTALALPTQ